MQRETNYYTYLGYNHEQCLGFVEDRGARVECLPLIPKVLGSNLVMSGLSLWDFSTQIAQVMVKFPRRRHQAWLIKAERLFHNQWNTNQFKLSLI